MATRSRGRVDEDVWKDGNVRGRNRNTKEEKGEETV